MLTARALASSIGLTVTALGGVVLLGWALDSAPLKSVFSELATMKANTALGMLVAGGALVLLVHASGRPARAAIVFAALVLTALGTLTLAEYLLNWDLHIDQWLFRDATMTTGTASPGRMSAVTALSFTLIGTAVFVGVVASAVRWRQAVVSALAVSTSLIGALALAGYAADWAFGYRLWNFTGIAVHTAAGFVLLGTGLVAAIRGTGESIWVLDAWTTAGFCVAAALMLTVAGVSYSVTSRSRLADTALARSQEILGQIHSVIADVMDLQAYERGYVLTGNPILLDRYRLAKTSVLTTTAALRRLVDDQPRQLARVAAFEPLVAQRIDWATQTIALYEQNGLDAAQRMIATGRGIALSDGIRGELGEMQAEYESRIVAQRSSSSTGSTTAFLLLPLGTLVSLTLLIVGVFLLNGGMADRRQADTARVASLKEVGDLKAALDEHAIVAITDQRGRITYVNDKFCAISKYGRDALLGQDHRLINSGHHPKAFIRDLWTTIARGRVWHGEIKNRAQDGTFYWVDTTIVPFLDDLGHPRQYVAIRADITERKLAEEALRASEARLAFALQKVRTGAWELSLVDHSANRTLIHDQIFGYETPLPAWTYERFLEHVVPEDRAAVARSFTEATTARSDWNFECRIRRADGEERWIRAAGGHELDSTGQPVRMAGIVQDITDRKRADAELQALNTELERRVRERTAELEAANSELESFSYSVSHDLRAPLRAIDGFSRAVLEDFGDLLPDEGHRQLQTVRNGAQRMGALIDDLLTFSRLSRSPLSTSHVNVRTLVEGILKDMDNERSARAIDVQLGDLPACWGDQALLRQVWINLLSNAFKYTLKREAPTVEIGSTIQDGRPTYFVRDNGTGFDMRYAAKLFGVFQRLHRAEDYEGTGVGLAIVQRIIQRHGGRVWADAAVERGATFYFNLAEGMGS